jgi:uncharacterized membrane protein YdjX (TVP38/TMEM64 family)
MMRRAMGQLFRTLPLMCVVILIPVVPFLFFGGTFAEWIEGLKSDSASPWTVTGVVVGLLATDIFLPVPSSIISTMSGWKLGWLGGTVASWVGLTAGAAIGFGLARRWGQPLALKLSKADDLDRMRHVSDRYGPVVLALTRAVPVFAEASVLIVGIHRLSWARFLPAVALSNLGVALAYAAFGDVAQQHQWLPLALGVSIALPILLAAVAHRFVPRSVDESSDQTDSSDEQKLET